jgi:DNA adenine methylase
MNERQSADTVRPENPSIPLPLAKNGGMALPAVMRYPGAKWSLAPTIISHFPPHFHYVEPFFGSGAVFFTKDPVPHEVINDRSSQVTNLFTVLRDQPDDLCWKLETTPWARDEYVISDVQTGDPLEDARRFVVRCWQAHASDLYKKTGWRSRGGKQRAGGMSQRWQKVPDQLRALALRLRDAEIENRDGIEVIERHAGPDVLIYADPPYPAAVRTQHTYAHEMDDAAHLRLLKALRNHPGPVVLSSYANEMYDEALGSWQRIELKAIKVEKGNPRTEVLWIKGGTQSDGSDAISEAEDA